MKAAKPTEKQAVSDELTDEWLKQGRKPEDVNTLLKEITKAVAERAMQGEMTQHLSYERHDPAGATVETAGTASPVRPAPKNGAPLRSAPFWQDGGATGRLRRDELRGTSLRPKTRKQVSRRTVYTESPKPPPSCAAASFAQHRSSTFDPDF